MRKDILPHAGPIYFAFPLLQNSRQTVSNHPTAFLRGSIQSPTSRSAPGLTGCSLRSIALWLQLFALRLPRFCGFPLHTPSPHRAVSPPITLRCCSRESSLWPSGAGGPTARGRSAALAPPRECFWTRWLCFGPRSGPVPLRGRWAFGRSPGYMRPTAPGQCLYVAEGRSASSWGPFGPNMRVVGPWHADVLSAPSGVLLGPFQGSASLRAGGLADALGAPSGVLLGPLQGSASLRTGGRSAEGRPTRCRPTRGRPTSAA